MREFKFRAWDKEFKVMLDGFSERSERFCIWSDGVVDECGVDKTNKWIVMQYTGLKDKNGKEIFEGDIVEWEAFDIKNGCLKHRGEVTYGEAKVFIRIIFSISLKTCKISGPPNLLVVGNIYEHPALLENAE